MRLRRGTLCSLPLALLFLTATTSAPPTLHSHTGGAIPHMHGGGHTHSHRDGHPHAHVHVHHHGHTHRHTHPHSTPVECQDQAAHYHLAWLFLDCSFPKSLPGQQDPLEAGLRLSPTVTVSSVTLDVRPLTRGGEQLLLSTFARGTANESELPVAVSAGMKMPGGLLCDTARRERSGVQNV